MLYENGTRILKFYLHISPEEQLERFKQRLDDPSPNRDRREKSSRMAGKCSSRGRGEREYRRDQLSRAVQWSA
jgi:polyphosphate kinase 2 PPK2